MPNNPGAQNPFPGPVDIDGYQRIAGSCAESQQIRLYSGNLQAAVKVVDVPTIGFPLRLTLFYNALAAGGLGNVGYGWTHNYAMNLLFTNPLTEVVFTSDSGRQFRFVQNSSGAWQLDTSTQGCYFFPGILTNPSSGVWRITFPDGSYFTFNGSSGNLTGMTDRHGNTNLLSYGLNAVTIGDPTGSMAINLQPTGPLVTRVADPNGNVTNLGYDSNSNLTSVALPTGCTTTYAYTDSTNVHLLTGRTDARSHSYSFTYMHDGSLRLGSVQDAEGNTISYSYGTVNEEVADNVPQAFPYTALSFTRNTQKVTWTCHFDLVGNLRRILDPQGHSRFFYWDQIVSGQGLSEQKLLLESGGFPYVSTDSHINTNNLFRRFAYDSTNQDNSNSTAGNLLYECDATGMITQYTYDSKRNVTSVYPGQAHMGVQGNWIGQYGADGYVLCAANPDRTDLESLPSYLSGSPTKTNVSSYHTGETLDTFDRRMDPRAVTLPGSLGRAVGFWQNASGSSFSFTVSVVAATSFNLSLYTHSADQPYNADSPLSYIEQFGRDVTFTVTDKNGTQSFRVDNNAPGVWVTFPVAADASHAVTVTAATSGANLGIAVVSAVAFDPYDSHRTTFNRDATTGDITSVVDALGNTTTIAYNLNGTIKSITSPPPFPGGNPQITYFYYNDPYQYLTDIWDAAHGHSTLAYDDNGNVLSVTDPNGNKTSYTYDANNRLKSITDTLGNVTSYDYDPTGNLIKVTDANGNATQFGYTNNNRLQTITDALNQITTLTYDMSGNVTGITDPKGHTTMLTYDSADRLVSVLLPDTVNTVTYAFDALDRLRAVASPNANQSNPSSIIVASALNWLLNYDVEDADPFNAAQAQSWSSTAPGAVRDANPAHAHSGTASLLLPSTTTAQFFSQFRLPILPGTKSLVRLWAMTDAQPNVASVWASMFPVDQNGNPPTNGIATDQTTLTATGTYAQTSLTANSRIAVPGDAQFTRFTTTEFRAYAQTSSGTANVWLDDLQVLLLSSGFTHDAEGRLFRAVTPDGAATRVVRDRFGRIVTIVDPRGRAVNLSYDGLNRVTRVVDPLQNAVQYAYDALSNLVSFTDPRNNTTTYGYDVLNRLTTITYPDGTTEQFTYDPASRLTSYTNHRGQTRNFVYDAADRLVAILYLTDNTAIRFSYDKVGNVVERTERNQDVVAFYYDATYRLTGESRLAANATGSSWLQATSYDPVGNRTQFNSGATGPTYDDQADYDTATYGAANIVLWSVPDPPGYDKMDRLGGYKDRLGNQTSFSYDAESRRTGIVFPNGTPAVSTAAGYDVVGKLLRLNTAGSSSILAVTYAYDLASNRIGLVANADSIDYDVDDSGRLVEEDLNAFVEMSSNRFRAGKLAGCSFDASGNITLLPFADTLSGSALDLTRWRLAFMSGDYVGMEIRPGSSLSLAFPRGYSNLQGTLPVNLTPFGLQTNGGNGVWAAAQATVPFAGNFDVQVNFSNLMAPFDAGGFGGPWGVVQAALVASPNPIESLVAASSTYALISKVNSGLPDEASPPLYPHYLARSDVSGTVTDSHSAQLGDVSGILRLTRTNGSDLDAFFWNVSLQPPAWTELGPWRGFSSAGLYLSLLLRQWPNSKAPNGTIGSTCFNGFALNAPTPAYPSSGTYTSGVYDAGQAVTWSTISWTAATPAGTSVQLQVFGSSSPGGPWASAGPYATTPSNLPANFVYRYLYYQATLTGNGSATPTLSAVNVGYSVTGSDPSAVTTYAYDATGNMVSRATVTASGTLTEVRNNYVTGTVAAGSSTVSNVSPSDLARLATGDTIVYYAFPAGTTVSSISTSSFVVSNNATFSVASALVPFTNASWGGADLINNLNQIKRNDVTPAGGATTTYRYAYDLSGNLISKTDGTSTWNFTWDEDNRLLQVQKTGVGPFTVSYTYDSLGRMMTRTDATGTTTFEWDGMTVVRETQTWTGGATYVYYAPLGELLSFDRTVSGVTTTFQVHSDALGSVRAISDGTGAVANTYSYGAWGNVISMTESAALTGFPYRFVGALGVPYDSATGMYYMRQRWYDVGLGRFVSRDPLGTRANPYSYAKNSPTRFVDPSGLSSVTVTVYTVPGFPGGHHAFVGVTDPDTGKYVTFGKNVPQDASTWKLAKEFLLGETQPGEIDSPDEWDPRYRKDSTARVTRTYRVSPETARKLLKWLRSQPKNQPFNIRTSNCATFAANALASGGVDKSFLAEGQGGWFILFTPNMFNPQPEPTYNPRQFDLGHPITGGIQPQPQP